MVCDYIAVAYSSQLWRAMGQILVKVGGLCWVYDNKPVACGTVKAVGGAVTGLVKVSRAGYSGPILSESTSWLLAAHSHHPQINRKSC